VYSDSHLFIPVCVLYAGILVDSLQNTSLILSVEGPALLLSGHNIQVRLIVEKR